jgi:hypothetical protein
VEECIQYYRCTTECRCVTVRGGCSRLEHGGGVNKYTQNNGDKIFFREGAAGQSKVKKCTWLHQRAEMCNFQSRREQEVGAELLQLSLL